MKFFEKITKQMCWLGFFHWNSKLKSNCVSFLLFVTILNFSSSCFFLFKTVHKKQHAESMVYTLFSILFIIWYIIFSWKVNKYAAFIDELNEIIEKSNKKKKLSSHCLNMRS